MLFIHKKNRFKLAIFLELAKNRSDDDDDVCVFFVGLSRLSIYLFEYEIGQILKKLSRRLACDLRISFECKHILSCWLRMNVFDDTPIHGFHHLHQTIHSAMCASSLPPLNRATNRVRVMVGCETTG